MPAKLSFLLVACLLAGVGPAGAHGVHHEVHQGEAAVLSLRYDDHSPLSHARCEVWRAQDSEPCFVGTTDEAGRLAFLPPSPGRYTVRAATPDGHGVRFEFDTASLSPAPGAGSGASTGMIAGVALILALFAGLAWLSRGSGARGRE